MTAVAFIPGAGAAGVLLGQLPERQVDLLGVLLILGQSLPLAMRRRLPGLCLVVIAAAFATHQMLGYPATFAALGLYVALYSAGAHLRRRRRLAAVTASAAYAIVAVILYSMGSPEQPVSFATFYLVLAAFWITGLWVRGRAAAESVRRQARAHQAVIGERVRIARELHDVVTHHVTAMIVQADATQFLVGDDSPSGVADGLTAISGTGREAMEELRYLLGVLDDPDGSQSSTRRSATIGAAAMTHDVPALGRLAPLVERTRCAGQPVQVLEAGQRRPVPAAVEMAIYRVVQEGLTNALKHARGRQTIVQVHYGEDAIDVGITTAGSKKSGGQTRQHSDHLAESGTSSGRGLVGLRERVRTFGGHLLAGPGPDGEFRVQAQIPLREHP